VEKKGEKERSERKGRKRWKEGEEYNLILKKGLAFTFIFGVIFCVYFYKMRTKYE